MAVQLKFMQTLLSSLENANTEESTGAPLWLSVCARNEKYQTATQNFFVDCGNCLLDGIDF